MKKEKSTYSHEEASGQAGLGESSCPQAALRNKRNNGRTKKVLEQWSKGEKRPPKVYKAMCQRRNEKGAPLG